MALEGEGIVDGSVNAQKALRRCRSFEALHLALAPAYHLMRILRPIVFSQALLMVAGKSEMPEGSAVGAQLVGRHPRRREALFAEQLAHQLDGRRPVATTLDQDLEDSPGRSPFRRIAHRQGDGVLCAKTTEPFAGVRRHGVARSRRLQA